MRKDVVQIYVNKFEYYYYKNIIIKMFFYAVAKGKNKGIFNNWSECQQSINGFSGAKFKKFNNRNDAEQYIIDINNEISSKSIFINEKKEVDDTQYVNIYTDGSLIRKNGCCYAGYGVYIPSRNIEKSFVLEGKKTNNRGELLAIISGIEMFKDDNNIGLHIFTDSDYSIKIFGETGEKYMLKDYKKSKNEEFPNSDLVKKAINLRENYILKFTHINSHTGNQDIHSRGNDKADNLAVKGAVKDYINSISDLGAVNLGFGIHKFKQISEVPNQYLIWVATDSEFEKLCIKNEQLRLEKEIIKKYIEK